MNLEQILNDVDKSASPRDKINALESEMRKQPQVDLKVNHYFSQGCVYARELFIPKGIMLTGKIHKYEQLNVLSSGKMKVSVNGEDYQEISAPFVIVSPPGTKRIAVALEDSVWLTIHGTAETDLEKIENHFISQSEDDYLEFQKKSLT